MASSDNRQRKAANQRAYRRRRDRGEASLLVRVSSVDLAAALIETGDLAPSDEDNREALVRAVERHLRFISDRYR